VLLNLLSNAAKFTSNGTIHLIAKYIKESNQNVEVLFEVKDTGKGIAKNKLSEVFKDFTQEDQSTFNKYGGTGLGLNIANKLVRMMGGEGILLQSELGIGSSFSFKLSIVKSSADNSKDLLFSSVYEEHISILIVDDNSINVLIAEKILKKHFVNAIVYKCYSGKEALEILENTSGDVNVILMDVYMPDMDGYECTKKIKNNLNWQNIPIIALTASDTTEERLKTKQEGFVDFVAKPILPEKLSVAIHESLKNIQNG
jgi:CheY-like chemotaxis protein